jgi:ribosomal protein S18 acetylase RimI-like enzyme
MARCVGRSQRTGEQCGRSAAAGATTCYYHGERLAETTAAARGRRRRPEREGSPPRAFTTRLLSKRTWNDFETLFAPGTGWGRCGCLFALDASRATRGGAWAQQRDANLATMRSLLDAGRSQGVLVYDARTPIGWCQFVKRQYLRPAVIGRSEAEWFITCFVVSPQDRGSGATSVALRAAIDAIASNGGGVVEAYATAIAPGPPPIAKNKDLYEEGGVLFWGGTPRVQYGVEVDGIGPVAALFRSRRSMHNAPLGGTVDLYRREGFEAVAVLPRPKSALVDRIVMRRRV